MSGDGQSIGTVIQAGAHNPEDPTEKRLCAAHKAAVEKWCAQEKGPDKGKFNDKYFKELEGDTGKPLSNVAKNRETPLGALMKEEGGGPSVAKSWKEIAADGGNAADAVEKLNKSVGENFAGFADKFDARRGGMASKISSAFKKAGAKDELEQSLFPDSMTDDKEAIEVKGPTDSENPPGQAQNYAKMSEGKKCFVVSCQSCGSKCKKSEGCANP